MTPAVGTPLLWVGFLVFVAVMLALDLGVFHRRSHAVGLKEALAWSGVWIALALLFAAGVWQWFGEQKALEFLTGYVIEKALSVDNLFVFVVIFAYFGVAAALQHRVLFWGIVGALAMRAVFIVAGGALLERFHWTIYLFGGILAVTGVKLLLQKGHEVHPERNPVIRLLQRLLPVAHEGGEGRFVLRRDGRLRVTPLFLALATVEVSDVVFALDSIPAVFAVSRDPFIVFTSNIFAILGLRSLYFLLAGVLSRFRYLRFGLSAVLLFVGAKMVLSGVFVVPVGVSLAVIAAILGASIAVSLLVPVRSEDLAAKPRA